MSKILLCLALVVAAAGAAQRCLTCGSKQVWSFGEATRRDYEIGRVKGQIKFFEKTKHVSLNVPRCYKVTHVRVTVDNPISKPGVLYDARKQVVTIAYRLLQYGPSSYEVVTKGHIDFSCSALNTQSQP